VVQVRGELLGEVIDRELATVVRSAACAVVAIGARAIGAVVRAGGRPRAGDRPRARRRRDGGAALAIGATVVLAADLGEPCAA
jgi:hypothetical protein